MSSLSSPAGAGVTASPVRIAGTPLRVAVVGCGAVSKANLLPVLGGHPGLKLVALVDRDLGRAQELARAYSVPHALTDLDTVMDEVDAVVLATPPSHHAQATVALAARGKHVFVEKPMATSLADAKAMVEAAERAGVTLAVGLYRRMLPSVRLMRALLESGDYGRPLAVDAEEGGPYGWQLASLAVLTKAGGGGGVLIDIGSHLIDTLLFMLGGRPGPPGLPGLPGTPRLTSYSDNARGGIETDCVSEFSVAIGAGDVPVRLELSRTRELRGSIRIRCERATLELERASFTQVLVHPSASTEGAGGSPFRISAEWADQKPYIGYQAFRAEIDDWVTAIAAGAPPSLSGRSVLPVVGLIDACYQAPRPLAEPWTDEGLAPVANVRVGSPRRRVLVTGAGGFLGGRATEVLRERHGWDVAALVHEPKSAARLARWPGEIVVGNIRSQSDMDRVMKGCDAVVHCAVGTSWNADETRKVTVDGTRTVAEAALRAGVRRFVHISTMFVHRRDTGGAMDETTPLITATGNDYGPNKLLAERAVEELGAKGLPYIILRPTRIYGPFSKTFTIRPLQAISEGCFAIKGDPSVPGNMVYVDNVVDAIARALEAPESVKGQAYLITDPEQLSLRDFYQFFADAVGSTVRVVQDAGTDADGRKAPGLARQWITGVKTIVLAPEVRALVHRVLDTDPVGTLPRRLWDLSPSVQARLLRLFGVDAAVIFRPDAGGSQADLVYDGEQGLVTSTKAGRDLGYGAAVPHARAMALTLEWAKYARLLRTGARPS